MNLILSQEINKNASHDALTSTRSNSYKGTISMNIYSKTPNGFYIYAYIRSADSPNAKSGTPYYIGKGSKKRAWDQHRKSSCGIWTPKDKSKIIILEQNLTELGALALERRLIKWYGRLDNNTGILRNKTEGGDGGSGAIRSQSTRLKMSKARTGMTNPKLSETMKGRKRSESHQANLTKALQNRGPCPEDIKSRIKETIKNKYEDGYINPASKRFKITNVQTGIIDIVLGLKTWARINNFNPSTVDWSYRTHKRYKHYLIEQAND